MGALATDTAVEGSSTEGTGTYEAQVSRDWEIWGPNGGYLAAIALRAAGRHVIRDRPASISVQFLRPGRFEPMTLGVRTVRTTRRADCVHLVARQGDDDILAAQVWAVDETPGLDHHHAPPPVDTPPEATPTVAERLEAAGRADEVPPYPFWLNFESRPLDWIDDWENRQPGEPVAGGWYRFAHDEPSGDPWVDAGRSVILADTFTWPAAARAHRNDVGVVAPSLDLSVQLHHHVPDSRWLLVRGEAPVAHRGTIGGTSRVWAADGRLAALASGTCLCAPVRR